MSVSTTALLTLLFGGGVIYVIGYLRAVMHRANRDYKATKAAVKPLRKGFWLAWWAVAKVSVGFVVLVGLLIGWAVSDARKSTSPQPKPTPSISSPAPKVTKVRHGS